MIIGRVSTEDGTYWKLNVWNIMWWLYCKYYPPSYMFYKTLHEKRLKYKKIRQIGKLKYHDFKCSIEGTAQSV